MTDEDATPIFEHGDVVYGDDPFKGEEDARPWVILSNHDGRPFHGEQYIALMVMFERAADAERTLIAEQVMRRRLRGLRNTLAFVAPDVDRVVLRTDDRTANRAVGYDDGEARFGYDGQAYVLTTSSR